jgi:hypothetical protein
MSAHVSNDKDLPPRRIGRATGFRAGSLTLAA